MIPHTIPIPAYNDATAVRQAISDIVHIVKNSEENNIPKFWRGDKIQRAFEQLAEAIHQRDTTYTPAVSLPIAPKPIPNTQSVQKHATNPTVFRPVTPPPPSQQSSPQIPIPQLPAPTPVHPKIPPIPNNFPASLPRVAPIPRVAPGPRVISPAPWYTHTAHTWNPALVLNHVYQQTAHHIFDENIAEDKL